MHRDVRQTYGCRNAPDHKAITRWLKAFRDTLNVTKQLLAHYLPLREQLWATVTRLRSLFFSDSTN